MESVISPWFVYLLNEVNAVIATFGVTTFLLGALSVGIYIAYFVEMQTKGIESAVSKYSPWKRLHRCAIAICVVSFLLALFIPNKKTIISMYVADKVTYDFVNKTVAIGKGIKEEIKRDILDIIEEVSISGNKSRMQNERRTE